LRRERERSSSRRPLEPPEGPTDTLRATPSGDDATPEPALFLALQGSDPLAAPVRVRLGEAATVEIGRSRALAVSAAGPKRGRTIAIGIPDRAMSGSKGAHARLHGESGRWILTDCGSKNGSRIDGVQVRAAALRDGDLIELGRTFLVYRDRRTFTASDAEIVDTSQIAPPSPAFATVVPDHERRFAELARFAASSVPIVLSGESGTGKEWAAQALHALSGRPGELVALNCGAIADTLLQSELFGHRAGAFTGARDDRVGAIRAADRGTLFLDEIGEMAASAQVAFLRVLDRKEVVPLGQPKPVRIDIRVVCATHRDLGALVRRGDFRHDLNERLGVVRAELPPLRDRREDLGSLIASILRTLPSAPEGVTIDADAGRAFMLYDWPGNIRELSKAIEASIVAANGDPILPEHLPEPIKRFAADPDRARVVTLLERHAGNVQAIADETGKDRKEIWRWMKRHRLEADSFRRK
jgi:transcriptional regulator of acetoin/glycerol metabolism